MQPLFVAFTIAAIAMLLGGTASAQLTMPSMSPMPLPSATPAPLPSPDPALVQRFQSFFADMIAGRVPTQNLTPVMQGAMTPAALAPVKQYFAALGTFQLLQYSSHDQLGGYQRYHFLATFSSGTQKVMFVLDPAGALAGFFNE